MEPGNMPLDTYPKELKLKDGRSITARLLDQGDLDRLRNFFHALPQEERAFFRHDVLDPELLRKWTTEIDLDHVVPLVAEADGALAALATLHFSRRGWLRHVGHLRLVIGFAHRRAGLGTLMTRELVGIAHHRDLEKVRVELTTDNAPLIEMLRKLGFDTAAVFKGIAKDIRGDTHDLAVMINDISNLSRLMEDWIVDSMIPAFRVPGGGH